MLTQKQIQRKKSQQHIFTKQNQQNTIKRKKSTSNLVSTTKLKKQNNKQLLHQNKKPKQQIQKKVVHSLSKGKMCKKSLLKHQQKNDQNTNSMNHLDLMSNHNMNHKKSVQNLHSIKSSKQPIIKLATQGEQKKQQRQKKSKNVHIQNTLIKITSQIKLANKKKKKFQSKQSKEYAIISSTTDRLIHQKKHQQKIGSNYNLTNFNSGSNNQNNENSKTLIHKKSSINVKNPLNNYKKNFLCSKNNKTKKPTSANILSHPQKSTSNLHRPSNKRTKNNRISQIIQKSILYSEVNYDFKQQISLLGSQSKKSQQYCLPYPLHSIHSQQIVYFTAEDKQKYQKQNNAAITIQKNFRGYIQRKYIQQARYIIQSIKKIQRFWRKYSKIQTLKKAYSVFIKQKKQQEDKQKIINQTYAGRNHQTSTSLITIKDLNDTCKIQKKLQHYQTQNPSVNFEQRNYQSSIQLTEPMIKNQDLKDIISNLLNQDGLNEALKQKIRNAMISEKQKSEPVPILSTKKSFQQPLLPKHPKQKSLSELSINLRIYDQEQEINFSIFDKMIQNPHQTNNSRQKQFYVQKKINMQINSQKYFNSPMNSSHMVSPGVKNIMMSPGIKKLSSPKCLSSSYGKQIKSSYNNYFKSAKNGNSMFSSPKKQGQQMLMKSDRNRSHQKIQQKQNSLNFINRRNPNQQQYLFNKEYFQRSQDLCIMKKQDYLSVNYSSSNKKDKQQPHSITQTSPIISCKAQLLQNHLFQNICQQSDINLLQTQNLHNLHQLQPQQQQTRRVPPPKTKIIKPFPTNFSFIQQFCLLITDYLRQQQQTTQIFIQKLQSLKYFKLQKIFKEWQILQFQQYSHDNQLLESMIIKFGYQYPTILSKSEKKIIMEYPSLRLFLHENQYNDSEIYEEKSPQNSYLEFILDVFQQSIYQNFKAYNMKNIHLAKRTQSTKSQFDYLSIILSQTMGNILKCSQMLCGSFYNEEMNEIEKEEKYLINQQRMQEMTNQYQGFDQSSCEMWILLLVGKDIFNDLVQECVGEMRR